MLARPSTNARRRVAEQRLAERRCSARPPTKSPLVWTALAVCLGGITAALAGESAPRPELVSAGSAACLVGWLLAWRRRLEESSELLLLAAIALAAAAWGSASWRLYARDDLGLFAQAAAEPVCLEGRVAGPVSHYPASEPNPFRAIPSSDRTVAGIRVEALRDGVAWRPASGEVRLTIGGDATGLEHGRRVRVYGQLRKPRPAMNPGATSEAHKLRIERRLAVVWTEAPACVAPLEDAAAGSPLTRWRARAGRAIAENVALERQPLVRAMALGDGAGLDPSTVGAFRRTGTLHLLVVSGLHMGMVALIAPGLAALGLLPRRTSWVLSLALVIAYAALVGARPPALRAACVAAAICVAALSGRSVISFNSLAGAAIVVFVVSPAAWLSAGTKMSFLATAVLLGVAEGARRRSAQPMPPLERVIRASRGPLNRLTRHASASCAWLLAATLAVQLAAWPLITSEFHIVSPAAAPLSVVTAPLVYLVVTSGVALLLCALSDGLGPIAALAGKIGDAAAHSLQSMVESTAALDGAGFYAPGPPAWWVGAWIAWLGGGALVAAYAPQRRGLIARGLLLLIAAGFAPILWQASATDRRLTCTFIAVGHGSATLLQTPDGRNLLVDAGALREPDRVADDVARALWARGVRRLDGVVLTHADIDHYNAIPGLLERFPVGRVFVSPWMFPLWDDPEDRSAPAELRRLLRASGVPLREVQLGDTIRLGEATINVLHPNEGGVPGSDNANSVVLGVEYAGRRVLLPADLEEAGLEELLKQEPYDCDLALAPHHGSARSDPPGFAAWCTPETVVISSGESRLAASEPYRREGARVLNTTENGMITAHVSEHGVRVHAYREP